jgi:glutathione S-transferase
VPDTKFWYAPGACSLAPHVLLHEICVPFDAVETSFAKGAHLTDEFARINPKKRLPVLSLDGEVITEVPAIATAIANLAPGRHLMGRTALDRVRVYEWMIWLSGTLHGQGFGGLWRPEQFSDDPAAFDGIRAKGRRTILDCFQLIEGKVTTPYSVGEGFTAVDPYLLVFYRWGNGVGIDMPGACPHYTAFARGLVQRESVKAALAAEGIGHQALRDHVPELSPAASTTSSVKGNAS